MPSKSTAAAGLQTKHLQGPPAAKTAALASAWSSWRCRGLGFKNHDAGVRRQVEPSARMRFHLWTGTLLWHCIFIFWEPAFVSSHMCSTVFPALHRPKLVFLLSFLTPYAISHHLRIQLRPGMELGFELQRRHTAGRSRHYDQVLHRRWSPSSKLDR